MHPGSHSGRSNLLTNPERPRENQEDRNERGSHDLIWPFPKGNPRVAARLTNASHAPMRGPRGSELGWEEAALVAGIQSDRLCLQHPILGRNEGGGGREGKGPLCIVLQCDRLSLILIWKGGPGVDSVWSVGVRVDWSGFGPSAPIFGR
ncbi:hypothetical protein N7532_007547 [Penicillium argentinense]|uniref:Uncharacterized protein n=1 Tax=Penicillium argentinense TaxID=1131581 RepID=A0A9W9F7W5_9EURO|nr:uncharacterized protein N7532_007547 [Penicillium argentinense]KAJ5095256.1 hypothetical protein N7532_007547 [Penicillium argentinense]